LTSKGGRGGLAVFNHPPSLVALVGLGYHHAQRFWRACSCAWTAGLLSARGRIARVTFSERHFASCAPRPPRSERIWQARRRARRARPESFFDRRCHQLLHLGWPLATVNLLRGDLPLHLGRSLAILLWLLLARCDYACCRAAQGANYANASVYRMRCMEGCCLLPDLKGWRGEVLEIRRERRREAEASRHVVSKAESSFITAGGGTSRRCGRSIRSASTCTPAPWRRCRQLHRRT